MAARLPRRQTFPRPFIFERNNFMSRLNVFYGAYKALGMMDKKKGNEAYSAKSADRPEPAMELDGDTEFERVIMTIPADAAHVVKITHIFNKHMEGNRRAYDSIIEQLKELAKTCGTVKLSNCWSCCTRPSASEPTARCGTTSTCCGHSPWISRATSA